MKRDIIEFVSKCLKSQQVKYKHQRSYGITQRMPIPEWKWESVLQSTFWEASYDLHPGDCLFAWCDYFHHSKWYSVYIAFLEVYAEGIEY